MVCVSLRVWDGFKFELGIVFRSFIIKFLLVSVFFFLWVGSVKYFNIIMNVVFDIIVCLDVINCVIKFSRYLIFLFEGWIIWEFLIFVLIFFGNVLILWDIFRILIKVFIVVCIYFILLWIFLEVERIKFLLLVLVR